MTSIIVTRVAEEHERGALGPLVARAYGEFADSLAASQWTRMHSDLLAFDWNDAGYRLIVVIHQGRLAGVAAYFRPTVADNELFPADCAGICLLAVLPSERRQGLGRMLTEECLARAYLERAQAIGLPLSEIMTVARPMYERLGFRIARELPRRFGVRHWLYTLDLRNETAVDRWRRTFRR